MGDLDADGKLEIASYVWEGNGILAVLTMNGKYEAKLTPWPLRFLNLHNNPVISIAEPAFVAVILAFALAQVLNRRGK